jgi:hypothetical protein
VGAEDLNKQIPWTRVVVEGVVIVGSILMAFGIEAWWDARQEDVQRIALLEDLEAELVLNTESVQVALDRQLLRIERIDILLNELTPDAVGLPRDSLRALQASIVTNPTYDAAFGVLTLLIQSGDLALLEDRTLRARLAALESVTDDLLGNQEWILQLQANSGVLFSTGSIVMDYSAVVPRDLTITEASQDTREMAAKYLTVIRRVTDGLLIGQGEELLAELNYIIELLRKQ